MQLAVLKDPHISCAKKQTTCARSKSIAGTSGHFIHECNPTTQSLLPSINIIKEEEINHDASESTVIGSGRFSTCHLGTFIHFKVCIEVPKDPKSVSVVINEANIISQFAHKNLPFLFGVCLKNNSNSLIMSYHGYKDLTITLHNALHPDPTIGRKIYI